MAKTDNLTDFLTGVANAIRTKKGTTAKINPQNFETEISSITTSKPEQEKTVEPTNTQQIISPDDGKTLSKVIIQAVPLPESNNPMYYVLQKSLYDVKSKTLILGCSDSNITPFDSTVVSIGNYAFYNCRGLKSISIPSNITSVGDYAFYGCTALRNVLISDKLISIGNYAFYFCDGLTNITILQTNPPTLGSNAIPLNVTTITVPAGCGNAYKTADGWSAYADKIVEATA